MSDCVQFSFHPDVARTLRVQVDVRIRELRQQMQDHGWGRNSCTGRELRRLETAALSMDVTLYNTKEVA